jgi:hypothetical protein
LIFQFVAAQSYSGTRQIIEGRVSLDAATELSTWAMMILGFAKVGIMA